MYNFFLQAVNQVRIKTYKAQVSSIFVQTPLWEICSNFCKLFSVTSLLVKKICKTLSNSPTEVSGRKCLKLGLSEFLSLLNSLPLRKRCTTTTDFRNIGVKCWVLVLNTLGVSRYTQLSVPMLRVHCTMYPYKFVNSKSFVISCNMYYGISNKQTNTYKVPIHIFSSDIAI